MNIIVSDIVPNMGEKLLERTNWFLCDQDKKIIIEEELINYTLEKLAKANVDIDQIDYRHIEDLSNLLKYIDYNFKYNNDLDEFFYRYYRYILDIAGEMQGFYIVQYIENKNKLIENPEIEFNAKHEWDKLTTHMETSPIETALFVWEAFQNEFKVEPKEPIKTILVYTREKNHC